LRDTETLRLRVPRPTDVANKLVFGIVWLGCTLHTQSPRQYPDSACFEADQTPF